MRIDNIELCLVIRQDLITYPQHTIHSTLPYPGTSVAEGTCNSDTLVTRNAGWNAYRALCVSVHVSTMFTMVTSPEGCLAEGGNRIREGRIREGRIGEGRIREGRIREGRVTEGWVY